MTNLSAELWVDYIYLDTDERRKFAQSSHEYLIEQLQFTGKETATTKIKLNFNHPVKELVWVARMNYDSGDNKHKDWINFCTNSTILNSATLSNTTTYNSLAKNLGPSSTAVNCVKTAKLILNGNDRFYAREGDYFNLVQPFQHHENVPNNRGINVYSFALKPEEHQPSGTLNMSRIDTATLDLTYNVKSGTSVKPAEISIFAVNYNVLRILSGMGGIAYSN